MINLIRKVVNSHGIDVNIEAGRCDLQRFAEAKGEYPVSPEERPP